jgi:2-dehydropantoate 2-reductase
VRFVVYGAGAVGGVIGFLLQEHGHEVAFVARGEHCDAMRRAGLRFESPDRAATLAAEVADRPDPLGITASDVVLLCVKSQDTARALDALASAAGPSVPVVCVQNGVANEREALRRFERVYGAVVMCPAAHLRPGVVQAYASPTPGLVDVGRYPSGVDGVAERVVEALSASSFESLPRADVMRWKYAKLLLNLGNALEAACGPAARRGALGRRAYEEGVACLEAAGIAFATAEEDRERRGDRLAIRRVAGERRGGGSSWQSLERRTGAIEADYLNGEIVLLGRLHGVATPVNAMLQRVGNRMARERAAPGSLGEDALLALLGESPAARGA